MDFKSISTGLGKRVKSMNLSKNRTQKKEIPLLNRGKQDQPEMFCSSYRKQ